MDQSAEGQGCQGKLKNAIDYALFVADGFQAFLLPRREIVAVL